MKKTPLKRGKPLKRNKDMRDRWAEQSERRHQALTAPPGRKLRKRPTDKKPRSSMRVYGPYHRLIGRFPCLVSEHAEHVCLGRVCGHHLKSTGSGGEDYGNEVPVCVRAHDEIHKKGPSWFERRYGVMLLEQAFGYSTVWNLMYGEWPPSNEPPSKGILSSG